MDITENEPKTSICHLSQQMDEYMNVSYNVTQGFASLSLPSNCSSFTHS
jgi:hypothetical protein